MEDLTGESAPGTPIDTNVVFTRTDFKALTARTALTECRRFEDPAQMEPLILRLRSTGGVDEGYKIRERSESLIEGYVEGIGGVLPAPVPLGGGVMGSPSKLLCGTIAMLDVLQAPPDGVEPYTFHEFVRLSVEMPTAFIRVTAWAYDLRTRAMLQTKNASGAPTES